MFVVECYQNSKADVPGDCKEISRLFVLLTLPYLILSSCVFLTSYAFPVEQVQAVR